MEIKLKRTIYGKKSTIGQLFINDIFFCHTLEDISRDINRDGDLNDESENKVHGQTAIPSGVYEVIINFSDHFKKYMPLLLNVAGFAGIRIHSGNQSEDTEGCILVGKYVSDDFIGDSRITYDSLMKKLQSVEKTEKIKISIQDLPIQKAA